MTRILAILLVLCSPIAWADVTAQLSERVIDELETVRLVIRATQTSQTETLDLSALEKDFHVLGTNSSSQYRSINGREQSWVDYQISLQPKRTGDLRIPAIHVGRQITPSLMLSVRPLSSSARQTIKELVFFEQDVSAASIYVQSQLVVTRRLLYSNGVQLYSDLPDAPELKDAVVMSLGEATSTTTERNGRRYGVVEQRYAIFPETSGAFTIPAINVTASVRLTEQGRSSRKGVRIGTEPQTIQVKPMPANYPEDQPWLPAEELQLHQVVSPSQNSYAVGDTLTHELLVHIQGNVGSIAPPVQLTLDADKFRTYPQNPVIADDTNGSQVTGSRLQTTSLLPLQPGTLVLPSTRVTWWNTRTDELQITVLESSIIRVTGGAIDANPDQPTEQPTIPATTLNREATENNSVSWQDLLFQPWLMAIFGVAFGYLCWLLLRKVQRRLTSRQAQPSAARLRREFKRSLQQADARQVQQALLQLLAFHYRDTEVRALQQFRQQQPGVAAALDELSRAQFSRAETSHKVSPAVLTQLQQAVDGLKSRMRDSKVTTLPPLYTH